MPVTGSVSALSRVIPVSELRGGVDEAGDSRLPFPVWRLGTYTGVRRRAIISWKNQISRELTAGMSAQIRQRGRELSSFFRERAIDELALVPAPSRPRRKREGLFVVGHIAHALCEGLQDGDIQARVCDVLTIAKKVSDRRAKAYAISSPLPIPRSIPIVLVDDVLVTGSTLVGCARALERQGVKVCCAFILAQQEKSNIRKETSHKSAGHRAIIRL